MSSVAQNTPTQFQDLLRSWRRIQKLSQSNLCDLAGISQRHLSFMESGRSAPSREMVLRLADGLDLPLRERNALLIAAGFASEFIERGLDHEELKQAKHALSVMLDHHEPYGALVIDRNWNLIMMNEANIRIFGLFVDPVGVWQKVGGDQPNLMRVCLHPDGLRPYIVNWVEFAMYFLGQLERELSTNPFNRQARELMEDLMSYPDMPTAATAMDHSFPLLPLRLKKGEVELKLFTMVSTFGTPLDVTLQEIRIETFFPADQTTEVFIRKLAK